MLSPTLLTQVHALEDQPPHTISLFPQGVCEMETHAGVFAKQELRSQPLSNTDEHGDPSVNRQSIPRGCAHLPRNLKVESRRSHGPIAGEETIEVPRTLVSGNLPARGQTPDMGSIGLNALLLLTSAPPGVPWNLDFPWSLKVECWSFELLSFQRSDSYSLVSAPAWRTSPETGRLR